MRYSIHSYPHEQPPIFFFAIIWCFVDLYLLLSIANSKRDKMEYLINCQKTSTGYDITNAQIISDDGNEERVVRRGFNYVTKGGWVSKKQVIVDFPIIEVERDDWYVISKDVVDMLISEFTGGKYFRLEYQESNGEAQEPHYIL